MKRYVLSMMAIGLLMSPALAADGLAPEARNVPAPAASMQEPARDMMKEDIIDVDVDSAIQSQGAGMMKETQPSQASVESTTAVEAEKKTAGEEPGTSLEVEAQGSVQTQTEQPVAQPIEAQ